MTCPTCRIKQYYYMMLPEKKLVSFCLCGVTQHDMKTKKR